MSSGTLFKGIAVLAALAAAATALLHLADRITATDRQRNNEIHAARLLSEVLPPGDYDAPPGLARIAISDIDLLGTAATLYAYPVYQGGQLVTVILSAIAPDGYVAPLQLLVGIQPDGQITGVRVAKHRETPGLGDKVDATKSNWITSFAGTYVADTEVWALKRDGGRFDHISGATITSRAVVNAVGRAHEYFVTNQDALLNAPAPD